MENEITINIREKGAAATDRAVKEAVRTFENLKKLTGEPLTLKINLKGQQEAITGFRSLAIAVRTFNTLLIATGVERFVKAAVTMVDGLTEMENKIRVVSDSLGAAQIAFRENVKIAIDSRAPLEAVATVYSRTARSVEELGYRQSEVLKFTKVLTQAVAVGGSTAIESSQAMIQLSQGMASGTLKGDELRSVLEQLPVVSKLIADHMHISVMRLRELGMQGKLTSHDVFDSIVEGEDSIQKKFSEMTPTFAQGWEVFTTSLQDAAKVFQPLVAGMSKGLIGLAKDLADIPVVVDVMSKNFQDNSDAIKDTWYGKVLDYALTHKMEIASAVASLAGGATGVLTHFMGAGEGTKTALGAQIDAEKKRREEREALESFDDTSALDPARLKRFKKFPGPPKKEGGLTFAEMVFKMRQEQEVANMTPFESDVTKEFFQKMGELKKSVREDLTTHAGKGGRQDDQLRQLQEMIRLEHELAEAQKFVRYWDEKIEEEKKKRMQISIDLGKKEQEAHAENTKRVYESDRAIKDSLDPLAAYNKEVEKFSDYLHRHPEDVQKVTKEVDKLSYAYQTFAPVFQQMSDGLADAAANALVFGNNLSTALKSILQSTGASMLSGIFKIGINALTGVAMPGISGGSKTVTAPAGGTLGDAARGGYFPGYQFGGYTGTYARGDVAGVVHGQEFVVNANATARNRAMLESMNAGKPVGAANVSIHNYAGAQVEATTNTNGDIEVMIHKAINDRAPIAVAQDLRNRNGKMAKALRQNYDIAKRN